MELGERKLVCGGRTVETVAERSRDRLCGEALMAALVPRDFWSLVLISYEL